MPFTYKIADDLKVSIFTNDSETAILEQDVSPLGEPWADKAEAEKWAKSYLKGIDERIANEIAKLEAEIAAATAPAEEPTEPQA